VNWCERLAGSQTESPYTTAAECPTLRKEGRVFLCAGVEQIRGWADSSLLWGYARAQIRPTENGRGRSRSRLRSRIEPYGNRKSSTGIDLGHAAEGRRQAKPTPPAPPARHAYIFISTPGFFLPHGPHTVSPGVTRVLRVSPGVSLGFLGPFLGSGVLSVAWGQ